MSGLLALAKPRRIKASHRRRRKVAWGPIVQRYYDPGIGRFLSVDPVTADSATGSNFNRYWYANNNPYKFTDPDGRQSRIGGSGRYHEDAPPPPPPPPPPEPKTLDPVVVTASRHSEPAPSFFQLTTFSALRKDMSTDQAVKAGELTRTVTLPALVVTASPSAIALGASTAPVVGDAAMALQAVGARDVPPLSVAV